MFKDWGVTNLELRREVTRKLIKTKLNERVEPADYTVRKYEDYLELQIGLLLTDRGSEFAKPQLFEINHETGEIRSNIFYCDVQMPSQKPHVENNHILIRNVIQKKKSNNNLTKDKLNLTISYIILD